VRYAICRRLQPACFCAIAGRYYLVTQTSCTCFDAARHVCKHQVAVLVHCARVSGTPMPSAETIDGLAQMAVDRNPTLTMVRHEDGEITWERREGAKGESIYLPRRQPPVPTAADYDRIFGRL
jgi:hypothetical protein